MDIFFKGQILFPVIMVELQNFCSARQRRWRLYIKENLGIITKVCCSKPKSVDEVSLLGELCTGKVLRKNSFWKKFPAFTEAKNDSTWTHWPGSGCLTLFLLWGGTWGLWLCPYSHPAVAAELGLWRKTEQDLACWEVPAPPSGSLLWISCKWSQNWTNKPNTCLLSLVQPGLEKMPLQKPKLEADAACDTEL